MEWNKKPVFWEDEKFRYYSIVFSWDLWAFLQRIKFEFKDKPIQIGGPAVIINKQWIPTWIGTPKGEPALWRHNPEATRTTYGCVRKCAFCAVPHIEPKYRELQEWEIKPVVCDNNLLAASRKHFDKVIDSLKPLKWCDFNQGLDARLMTKHHAERLAELKNPICRLAFDSTHYESAFLKAFYLLENAGIPKRNIHTYVLIGFDDTPEDALYRLRRVQGLGIRPNPMRYQPVDAKHRNEYVSPKWTERELKDYMRYWSSLRYLEGIPFEEYRHTFGRKGISKWDSMTIWE